MDGKGKAYNVVTQLVLYLEEEVSHKPVTYPYSGTQVIGSVVVAVASMICFHAVSKNLLSSLKSSCVGAGHCDDCVVPIRAWI